MNSVCVNHIVRNLQVSRDANDLREIDGTTTKKKKKIISANENMKEKWTETSESRNLIVMGSLFLRWLHLLMKIQEKVCNGNI